MAIPQTVRWTIDDLDGFPEDGNRYEIIDGELFVTRSPHWNHQRALGRIYQALATWSQQTQQGEAMITPGLIFSGSTNVIPDVVWISDARLAHLLDDRGHLSGAPELVVEVLSRTEQDQRRDRETKLKLYSIQGVLEYWILDYEQQRVEVYHRNQGSLERVATLLGADHLTSPLLPEFRCPVVSLFL